MMQGRPTSHRLSLGLLAASICAAACGGDSNPNLVDAMPGPDSGGCDPATALPSNYRPIPRVSTGMVEDVTMNGDLTSATVDATAGGGGSSADNPYIYLDLRAGAKVDVNDLDARTSGAWDVSLKRVSLRVNGGDSGSGGRKLAVIQAATLAEVAAAPSGGYAEDRFVDADCMLISLRIGEPSSAFGEWYSYDDQTHVVTPKAEVYVLERPDGSHTALRIINYASNGTTGLYQVEWKQL